jgi:DNA-binding CsgD family transcriptional regulator
MKTNMSLVPVFRAIAGIAASAAIFCLLSEEGLDDFDAATIAYILVALLSLAGALVPTRAARGLFPSPRPSGLETFRLEAFGVTPGERKYVLELLGGKTMKAIALEHGVSHSTVRNALSSVYEKLGISGSAELLALGAYYRVE